MFKYFIWVSKIGIRVIWEYLSWMRRYARHPERYSAEDRFSRGQRFARIVLKRLKVDVEVRNEPTLKADEVYYFVANHSSLTDALVVLGYMPTPISFVSKKENRELPFVRTMFQIVGGIYIERDNLKQEIRAMQTMRNSLAKKESSWIIFPEGTRNRDYHGPLLEYKAGSFKAPLQTNTTIVPLVLQGTQLILPRKTRAKRYKVILEYLPLVEPTGTTIEIADHLYDLSNARLSALKDEYRETQKLNKYGQKMIRPLT